ncbi:plastocyanin/azurin family copper-binding protein [Pengzhenrongella frigida]|nr:plastocyanin/azurin family copper-binding protein [Cellulomonas sp. HLT2-17]
MTRAGLALVASSMLILAGCSSTDSGGAGSSGAPSGLPATATGGPSSSSSVSVTATETEFSITLSQAMFTPGEYVFKVSNDGTLPHDLTIEGPGVGKKATPNLNAGQSGELTATLQAGTYELWCSVPGHKGKGMDLKITVA